MGGGGGFIDLQQLGFCLMVVPCQIEIETCAQGAVLYVMSCGYTTRLMIGVVVLAHLHSDEGLKLETSAPLSYLTVV